MKLKNWHMRVLRLIALTCATAMTAMIFAFPSPTLAVVSSSPDTGVLLEKYRGIRGKLDNSIFGLPIYIESNEKADSLRGDVYGILHYPFKRFATSLQSPAAWCKITTLHLNIKACTFQDEDGSYQLSLYSGSKHYQSPEKAHRLDFNFQIAAKTDRYLKIAISAEKGPYFAKECLIGLEAVSLGSSTTLVHFSYSYQYGTFMRILIKTYLATAGYNKVGFSVQSTAEDGNPVYVRGVRGAIERNAVRYFLALMAYLDTSQLPEPQQFDKRISEWFTLTERFPRQLHEIDRKEYLDNKIKEHRDGLKLKSGHGVT
jgi:hypothetical protein